MKFYWGDEVNGWRIWGWRFGRNRYLTVAFSINKWEDPQSLRELSEELGLPLPEESCQ